VASTPEVKAKAQILRQLRATVAKLGLNLWLETHAGDAFSTPTLDITGVLKHPDHRNTYGVPFAIEVKRFDGRGKLTGRQEQTMQTMRSSGIAVFLIDSEDSLSDFISWMERQWPLQLLLSTKAT
jgi:hypothetical protein